MRDIRQSWLLSFSDLLMLLLCFFVIRYSAADTKKSSKDEVATSKELEKILKHYEKFSADGVFNRWFQVENLAQMRFSDKGKIEIHLFEANYAFDSEGLSFKTENFLTFLYRQLEEYKKSSPLPRIRIEGHTDSAENISTSRISGWELSSSRAISVANFLVELGIPAGHISVMGYADSKPLEKIEMAKSNAGNLRNSPSGHRNRRIEITLFASKLGGEALHVTQ